MRQPAQRMALLRSCLGILGMVLVAGCGRELPPPPQDPPPEPPPAAAPRAETRTLRLAAGAEVEAELAGGQTHVYPLELAAGQYAALVVDQRGIDVVASLFAADDRRLTRVDSFNGSRGPEPVPVLADGALRLEVSAGRSAAPGRYAVVVAQLRPATARDRDRVAAERAFADAEALRRQRSGEARRAAVARYREALAMLQALGEHGRQAQVRYSLGRVYLDLGEAAAAVEAYERAVATFRELRQERWLGLALSDLGYSFRLLGEPEKAVVTLLRALEIDRGLGRRPAEGVTLINLARAYASLGKTEEALRRNEQALAVWRELGQRREDEASTLSNMGALYFRLGEREKALEYLERALALLEAEGAADQAAVVLTRLGWVLAESGRPRDAIDHLLQAVPRLRSTGNQHQEAVALNNLGRARHWLARLEDGPVDPEEARDAYARALAIFRELGDRRNQAAVLANLGWFESELGRTGVAVESYDRALPLFAEAGDLFGEAAALYGLARTRRRQGDLPASQAAIERALERIETLRGEPARHQLRSSFFASKQDYYSFYVDLLMELHLGQPGAGYDARAFEAGERARARSLLDLMAEADADLRRGVDAELLRREADLVDRLRRAEQRRLWLVESGAAPERRAAAEAELRGLLALDERIQAEIRTTSSNPLTQAVPSSLREVQRQVLDGDTLLLAYALGEERSFVWAVTSDAVDSFELAPRAVLEGAARGAHALLAAGHQTLARAQTRIALAELGRLLLEPLAERLSDRRLLIVPDGALHYVPFAALPIPGGATGAAGTPPLVAEHEVVTLPSASTLVELRRDLDGRRPAPKAVAVLADPVFDAADPRVGAAHAPENAVLRSASGRLARLPFSRSEAEAIRELVPPPELFAALDFDANREALGELGRYRILHFATHGFFDPDHPDMSGLALSLVDEEGRPRDGFLHAREIYRMDLAADLVVLSACRTALGKEVRGEGLVGLTRAFMVAGARRVLVSLWQVDDRATAELMQRFYREMRIHARPPAAALRQAQRTLRQEKSWEAPYYWAGFVLHGDG